LETLSLNGTWSLLERPLPYGPDKADEVLASEDGWLPAEVPGDASAALVCAGVLPEPLEGTNFRRFSFVEERSWWWRKAFVAPATWQKKATIEIALDGLDVHADIWLNGRHLGHHASAFRPFVGRVENLIRWDGENTLLVRLTCGKERVPADADPRLCAAVPTEASRGYSDRGFPGRIYLRKPAFVWGWDWSPRLATTGITGDVLLRALARNDIRDVFITGCLGEQPCARLCIEIERQTLVSTVRADICAALVDENGERFTATAKQIMLRSGLTHVHMEIPVSAPRLWWPRGSGAQHRYRVEISLSAEDEVVAITPFLWGFRTVEMINERGRFGFRINGEPIFIQGGNWVPADALYGRVRDEKIVRLVEEAAEANFNCLRIWGGGRFERDVFYETCDRCGIMVWHDFMSACAPLPADNEDFRREFIAEADYQLRRLRSRACIILWCGNNEVGGCYEWFADKFAQRRDPGWRLYFEDLPRLLSALAPHIPYWPTSPYGGAKVGDAEEGDDHHWVVMSPDSRFWSSPEYWDEPGRSIFNSEYGYGGPCSIESTRQYLACENPSLESEVAREHTNTFYNIERVRFSIKEHYADPIGLSLEDYILYGGLCQGLNLGYSLESLRANGRTLGAIFWMYNDAWGENGWSIIDYYLRRKISYYHVRRCLAPRRLLLRPGGKAFGGKNGEVVLIALNAGAEPLQGMVRMGYMSYDGHDVQMQTIPLRLAPRRRCLVASMPAPESARLRCGTIVAIPDSWLEMEPAWWRHSRFRASGAPPARARIVARECQGEDLLVTVASSNFAHAVHLAVPADYRLSDNFFDLLPGESRTVRIFGGAALAAVDLRLASVHSSGIALQGND